MACYILVFRIAYDIVGSNEPEFYPIERVSSIALVMVIILSGLIFFEHRERSGKNDWLFIVVAITFCFLFAAENNWLLGRETLPGALIFGIALSLVFFHVLMRFYRNDKLMFGLFFIGVLLLLIGAGFDSLNDELLSIDIMISTTCLMEEIPELYACLAFLHSIVLLYLHSVNGQPVFPLDNGDRVIIVASAVTISMGSIFLLAVEGEPVPANKLVVGIVILILGMAIPATIIDRRVTKRRQRQRQR